MTTEWKFTFEGREYMGEITDIEKLSNKPHNTRSYVNDIINYENSQDVIKSAVSALRITTPGRNHNGSRADNPSFKGYRSENINGSLMLVMDSNKRLHFSCTLVFDDPTMTALVWNIFYSLHRERNSNCLIGTYDIGMYFAASFARARYNNVGRVLVVNETPVVYRNNMLLTEHDNNVKLFIKHDNSFVIDRSFSVERNINTEEDHTAMIFSAHELMDVVMEKQIKYLHFGLKSQ